MKAVTFIVNLSTDRTPTNIEGLLKSLQSRFKDAKITRNPSGLALSGVVVANNWELIHKMVAVQVSLRENESVKCGGTTAEQYLTKQLHNGTATLPKDFDLKSSMIKFILGCEDVSQVKGYFHGESRVIYKLFMVVNQREVFVVSNVDCEHGYAWVLSYNPDSIGVLNGKLYSQLAANAKLAPRYKLDEALQLAGWNAAAK